MTPEQQRIAIAEACGWSFGRFNVRDPQGKHQTYVCGLGRDKERYNVKGAKEALRFKLIPNYLNDLNAMHEAEKVLREDQFSYVAYWQHLFTVVAGKEWTGDIGYFHFEMAHATASQRAEAFLRTLDLWK